MAPLQQGPQAFDDLRGPLAEVGQGALAHFRPLGRTRGRRMAGGELRLGTDSMYMGPCTNNQLDIFQRLQWVTHRAEEVLPDAPQGLEVVPNFRVTSSWPVPDRARGIVLLAGAQGFEPISPGQPSVSPCPINGVLGRIRTGVRRFAAACLTTQPPGHSFGVSAGIEPCLRGSRPAVALRPDTRIGLSGGGRGTRTLTRLDAAGFQDQAPPHWGQPLRC